MAPPWSVGGGRDSGGGVVVGEVAVVIVVVVGVIDVVEVADVVVVVIEGVEMEVVPASSLCFVQSSFSVAHLT